MTTVDRSPSEWAEYIASKLTPEELYAFVGVLDGDPGEFEGKLFELASETPEGQAEKAKTKEYWRSMNKPVKIQGK